MTEMVDIVNEQDEVIGTVERGEVRAKGFIARMVFVCFYTPDKKNHPTAPKRTKENSSRKANKYG